MEIFRPVVDFTVSLIDGLHHSEELSTDAKASLAASDRATRSNYRLNVVKEGD